MKEKAAKLAHEKEVTSFPSGCTRCDARPHIFRCMYHEGQDDTAAQLAAAIRALPLSGAEESKK